MMADEQIQENQQQEERSEQAAAADTSDDSSWLELRIEAPSSTSFSSSTTASSSSSMPIVSRPMAPLLGYRLLGHWNTTTKIATNFYPQHLGFWSSSLRNLDGNSSSRSIVPQFYNLQPSSPPTRPLNGIWFVLKAAENQVREPFLPQIPKSYIRTKDGKMTVRLLMKYLVNKLALHDESEVQVSCRGHALHPLLTLQHVRDNIWCLSDAVTFISYSASNNIHVMTLHYGRSS